MCAGLSLYGWERVPVCGFLWIGVSAYVGLYACVCVCVCMHA